MRFEEPVVLSTLSRKTVAPMQTDPEVFGGFLLVRCIKEGAMATVHLAVRLGDTSGRPIVLKRPPLGERASGRAAQAILREAEVLGEVRGTGFPALEATGEIAGLPYVAVERLRGSTLASVLRSGEPLAMASVRAIGKDVGRALSRLHEAGWVHRDITPSNIFIDDAGEAYVIDLGLSAKAGDPRSALVAGTRGYAAPEAAIEGAAHPARDVYGLAVCLAEAALGRRVFEEGSLVEAAGRGDAPPRVAALENELCGICAALRRDPSQRPSAASFASGLGDSVDREELALRVSSASLALAAVEPSPAAPTQDPVPALTPTVTMPAVVAPEPSPPFSSGSSRALAHEERVVPTLRDVEITSRDIPHRAHGSASGSASLRGGRGGMSMVAVLAIVAVALFVGHLSGRFSSRGRASFAITGAMPKRTEVLLDGKNLTFADGVPLNVPPGDHTLTVTSPKVGTREIPFSVRPGQHVIIVSPLRAGARATDP